ncbi:tRNA-His guanylyltransferase [Pseudocyphellaria aurata]|nr:tRNA-His guanylyltransferase [Pseudocyphellaria aurata]
MGAFGLCDKYKFEKPNDRRALDLMNAAAIGVMDELPDVRLAYGISDEFRYLWNNLSETPATDEASSFILGRSSKLFERRESKILTTIVSTFTSYYIHLWQFFFPEKPLSKPMPSFDGRVIQYPTFENIRDYLSWRQVDCHINNLYNTTFWALQHQGGLSATQAEKTLKVSGSQPFHAKRRLKKFIQGTLASDKHEILFSRFKINYNNELEMFKKGSLLYRNVYIPRSAPKLTQSFLEYKSLNADTSKKSTSPLSEGQGGSSEAQGVEQLNKAKTSKVIVEHTDIIKDKFWEEKTWLLPSREQ